MDASDKLEAIRQLLQQAGVPQREQAAVPPTPVKQRVVGAALFGFLVAAYAQNAAERTVPVIMSMVQKIDLEAAKTIYSDSSLYHTSVLIVANFLGAAVAGFLARRKGILAGILSISLYILLAAYMLLVSVGPKYSDLISRLPLADDFAGDTSVQRQIIPRLLLFCLAAAVGGFVGEKLYAPEIDLDLNQPKITIFGVRWAHYFWILPLIYLAFLCSALMIVYGGITVLLADLSLAWHPSLWLLDLGWAFPTGPFLVWLAMWMTAISFARFFGAMQYGQTQFKGWKKVGRVLLYGVGAPALSYSIAALGANVAHTMPKPVEGDWKIVVGIVAGIAAIVAIASLISTIRAKRSNWDEAGTSF